MGNVMISIIIPIYNVEAYLEECLESVIHQENISCEILCVNDGSTDNSFKIASDYAKRISNLQVLNKSNGGLSSARNYGLTYANGKYVYFLDSDDCLANPKCLETIITKMETDNLDILYFDGTPFYESEEIRNMNSQYETMYTRTREFGYYSSGRELFEAIYEAGQFTPNVGLQVYRTSLLKENQVEFPEGLLYEDNIFSFKAMLCAGRVAHINNSLYMHRVRQGSIMQSGSTFKNFYSFVVTYYKMLELWEELPGEVANEAIAARIEIIKGNVIQQYNRLDAVEKQKLFSLSSAEQFRIKRDFISPIEQEDMCRYVFPYHLFKKDDRVCIYGAGRVGKAFYALANRDKYIQIMAIVDKNVDKMIGDNIPVVSINALKNLEYDYVLVAVEAENVANEIKKELQKEGITAQKILWAGKRYSRKNHINGLNDFSLMNRRILNGTKRKNVIFMYPEHGNVGDHGIAIGQKLFFNTYFEEYDNLYFTINEWIEFKNYIVELVKDNDNIFLPGGGFLGNIWNNNRICREIIKTFSRNRKFILPHTLTYYDNVTDEQKLEDLKELIDDENMIFCFRDKRSFNILKRSNIANERLFYYPDMALNILLGQYETSINKNGKVLLCLRDDTEKIFNSNEAIKKLLGQMEIGFEEHSTHKNQPVLIGDSQKNVYDMIYKMSEFDLVITDRLHGMIFSYLAGTPCIAFDNSTRKVSGVYQWIKQETSIKIMETFDKKELEKSINSLKNSKVEFIVKDMLVREFKDLTNDIKKLEMK